MTRYEFRIYRASNGRIPSIVETEGETLTEAFTEAQRLWTDRYNHLNRLAKILADQAQTLAERKTP